MPDKNHHDLIVLGGGPGGYAAAFHAADKGFNVTLIDPEENPGGTCLYRGCIPSKAMLHAAKVISDAREASEFGVDFAEPKIDVDKLRAWKGSVVERLTSGVGKIAEMRKVKHIRGTGSFVSNTELEVKLVDGTSERHTFDKLILATGSLAISIPGWPMDNPRMMLAKDALDLPEIPKTMLIVGGGYIGLELGSVYATLGTKVTVVEMMKTILPGADKDLVRPLNKRLKQQFEAIHLETKVSSVNALKTKVKVEFEGKGADDARKEYDYVLVSVGRKPNSANLGLENTNIELDDKGFVQVDDKRRTAEANIWAIGDIAGEPMLAHKASHEGRVAVEAIAGEKSAGWDPRAIPAVVFTDPEIAWAGLMEDEAKAKGIDVQVVKFPLAASGRAITLGRTDGLTKLVVNAKTKKILGLGIAGPNAGDMIAEGVLAIEMGCVADDLRLSIHPHPTLSEAIMESADLIFNQSPHYMLPKKR
ncbi:dihydrolipoyl dehydrogenase [bacterium]|nr:dihydrolipoyl dehydrogenase [bacterium]